MRFCSILLILGISIVTQSCRVEVPSLVDLVGRNYDPYNLHDRSQAIRQKGFNDTLIIGDTPKYQHGKDMLRHIVTTGIPEKHTVFFEGFESHRIVENIGLGMLVSGEHEILRIATRVIHLPYRFPLVGSQDVPRIMENNILFVKAAGNMPASHRGDRDAYNFNHSRWRGDTPQQEARRKEFYKNVLDIHKTDKVIAATSATITKSGVIEPFEEVFKCGDIEEACFTMMPEQYTSNASARLSAMSFYLSQFWETPEEVVEVLKQCAIDVGEPGVDREYGQGVANLLCPPVLKKELEVVSAHLEETETSPETEGGELEGSWSAENSVLEVHIPTALKETIQPAYQGVVNGTVEFRGDTVQADFTAEASVTVEFLLLSAIEATAENAVQLEGVYTAEGTTLTLPGNRSLTYTAAEDSLHLIQSYTLNEALALLPEPFSSMVDMTSEDFFVNDPIQIRMSFARAKPALVGDFNKDGRVNVEDFLLFVEAFGAMRGDIAFNEVMDIVPDGIINIADFLIFINNFGKTG